MKDKFRNASRTFKKLNPDLHFVGCVEANRAKPTQIRPLEQVLQKPKGRAGSMEVRVTIIAYRRRLLDAHDAVAYACKPLTDAIAETLHVDDADPRLSWHYEQHKSLGIEGVIVEIETLNKTGNEY